MCVCVGQLAGVNSYLFTVCVCMCVHICVCKPEYNLRMSAHSQRAPLLRLASLLGFLQKGTSTTPTDVCLGLNTRPCIEQANNWLALNAAITVLVGVSIQSWSGHLSHLYTLCMYTHTLSSHIGAATSEARARLILQDPDRVGPEPG